MANEWEGAGAGAGGGAVQGAAVGTQIAPGWGTLIGAGIGAGVGGASGYFGTRGANKRKKALKNSQREYNQAMADYKNNSRSNEKQYQDNMMSMHAKGQANFNNHLTQMPGDQTQALSNDYQNQIAALQAPSITPVANQGALSNNYASEQQARSLAALSPMASQYASDQQGQAFVANDNAYSLGGASLQNDYRNSGNFHDLAQSDYNLALTKARARYNQMMQKAQNAGSEDMMYAGLINAGMKMAGGAGGAMGGMGAPTPATGTGAAFSSGAGTPTPSGGANSQLFYNP